jgi:hypothetical protein
MRRRGRPGRAPTRPWRWLPASCSPSSPDVVAARPGRWNRPDPASRPRSPNDPAAATSWPGCARADTSSSSAMRRPRRPRTTPARPGRPEHPAESLRRRTRPGPPARPRDPPPPDSGGHGAGQPYARTRETAELAFGRDGVRVTRDLLNEAFPGTDDEDLARRLRRLFTTRPPAGQNTVLVSHGFNLQGAAGLLVAEGESAVFSPATRAAPAWSPGSPPRSGRAWRSRAERGRRWDALRPSGMG